MQDKKKIELMTSSQPANVILPRLFFFEECARWVPWLDTAAQE